jgi:hypothetical protein
LIEPFVYFLIVVKKSNRIVRMSYEKWHTTNIDVERENNAGVAIEVLVCGAYTLKERRAKFHLSV